MKRTIINKGVSPVQELAELIELLIWADKLNKITRGVPMHKYKSINNQPEMNIICCNCGIRMDLIKRTPTGNIYKCTACSKEQEVR